MVVAIEAQKIAVLIDPDTPHLHGYLEGIRDFANGRPGWELHGVDLPCYHDISDLSRWEGDGCIIASDPDAPTARGLISSSRQAVAIGTSTTLVPTVSYDGAAGMRAVGQHFLAQGVRHFVLLGEHQGQVKDSVGKMAKKHGVRFDVADREALRDLLGDVSQPVGVFAPDCATSVFVRQLGIEMGLETPSDLLVFSLGDDANCELASPPVSSVPFPARNIGFQAAQMLGERLAGGKVLGSIAVAPETIDVRASSLRHDETDPLICAALFQIEETVKEAPMRVNDLAKKLGISRAHLTKRFQRVVGQAPADFIRKKRLEVAMQMLNEPGQMVKAVAITMGFSSSQEFARFFKNASGVTPTQFAGADSGSASVDTD